LICDKIREEGCCLFQKRRRRRNGGGGGGEGGCLTGHNLNITDKLIGRY